MKVRKGIPSSSTKTVSLSLQQIQAEIKKPIEKPPIKTAQEIEEESIFQFNKAASQVLPKALTHQQDPVHHELLSLIPNPEKIVKYRAEIVQIDAGFLDSTNDLLMMDPIRRSRQKTRQAIEREECIIQDSPLYSADAARHAIEVLLKKHPKYEDIQYLPNAFKRRMTDACVKGDINTIRLLYKKNRRFLWTPDPDSGKTPLQSAIQNEKSLDVIIDLLEQRSEGFALANLLHPDKDGRSLLENALRLGSSLSIIQKLMAWMGGSLKDFKLTGPLPDDKKWILNQLLIICILRDNFDWAKTVISWGGDLQEVVGLANENDIKLRMIQQLISVSPTMLASSIETVQAGVPGTYLAPIKIARPPNAFSPIQFQPLPALSRPQEPAPILPQSRESVPTLPRPPSPEENLRKKKDSSILKPIPEGKPSQSQLFKPSPNMTKLAICFVQAIIDDKKTIIETMLASHPKLLQERVKRENLNFEGKKIRNKDVLNITPLQCAFMLHSIHLYELFLLKLPRQDAIDQLGSGEKGEGRLKIARERMEEYRMKQGSIIAVGNKTMTGENNNAERSLRRQR